MVKKNNVKKRGGNPTLTPTNSDKPVLTQNVTKKKGPIDILISILYTIFVVIIGGIVIAIILAVLMMLLLLLRLLLLLPLLLLLMDDMFPCELI